LIPAANVVATEVELYFLVIYPALLGVV